MLDRPRIGGIVLCGGNASAVNFAR